MDPVCLSCLNKIESHELSRTSGIEKKIFHDSCYVNNTITKVLDYVNKIKSSEPEEIVSELFVSPNKFKLTEQEIEIVKQNISAFKSNKQNNLSSSINDMINKINLGENTVVDAMFNSLSNNPNSDFFKNFSKSEFNTLINSSLNLVLNDETLCEQIIGENLASKSDKTSFSDPETLTNKLMESWPEELKTKFSNLKDELVSQSLPNIFSKIPIGNLLNKDVDVDTDIESECEKFEQDELD